MSAAAAEPRTVTVYIDYKSPYAYLAKDPAYELERDFGVRLDWRLREGNRGRWEGRLFADVAREEPDLYAAWMRAGPGWRFPGGESLLEQQQRVVACIEDIRL